MPFLDRIKRWFQPPPQPQIRVVTRDILRVSMEQWRSDETLTGTAYKALHDPAVRAMLDILRTSSLLTRAVDVGAPLEQRAIRDAMRDGYIMALNDFEALGEQQKAISVDEPTFSRKNYLEQFATEPT